MLHSLNKSTCIIFQVLRFYFSFYLRRKYQRNIYFFFNMKTKMMIIKKKRNKNLDIINRISY